MNCAPLNLAHFHERRSEKFLRKHRYDDAYKAVQTSLLYLQDAYKNAQIDKSIEILNTQKWDYERRLRQIEMQKMQYERMKSREIVPVVETSVILKPTDTNLSAQSVAKSIDRTIEIFDTKGHTVSADNLQNRKEIKFTKPVNNNVNPADANEFVKMELPATGMTMSDPTAANTATVPHIGNANIEDLDELLSLTPLELPSFDINLFTSTSAPSLASFNNFAIDFQK